MRKIALVLSLVLLPGVLVAQAASFTYIDQKAPYKNPSPPILTALNLPKVGTAFQVQVPAGWSSGFASASYWLGFGVSTRTPRSPCGWASSIRQRTSSWQRLAGSEWLQQLRWSPGSQELQLGTAIRLLLPP